MQVAEGNHHKCRLSVCASCWNEKHHQRKLLKVRGTGHQHPLTHVGAKCSENMQLAHGTTVHHSNAHVGVVVVVVVVVVSPCDMHIKILLKYMWKRPSITKH